MRRRDREVTDLYEISHILDSSKVLHLGLVEDGMPYVLPMNYGYILRDGKLTFYVHGALEGRKLDVIRKNPNCCAELECDVKPFEGKVACQYGTGYYSLIGFGKAVIVEDVNEKIEALTLLMKTQTGRDFGFNDRLVSVVTVIRIDCDTFTAKHRPLPPKKIDLRETTEADLENVRALWADGDVMRYVGFPEGLHKTPAEMSAWLQWIESARPLTNHFSIYDNDVYCGESFYRIDPETKRAALDIKLFNEARGKGIASSALTLTIEMAFKNGAECAWVDPNPANEKALRLYRSLGMKQKEMPADLYDPDYPNVLYFEIRKDDKEAKR